MTDPHTGQQHRVQVSPEHAKVLRSALPASSGPPVKAAPVSLQRHSEGAAASTLGSRRWKPLAQHLGPASQAKTPPSARPADVHESTLMGSGAFSSPVRSAAAASGPTASAPAAAREGASQERPPQHQQRETQLHARAIAQRPVQYVSVTPRTRVRPTPAAAAPPSQRMSSPVPSALPVTLWAPRQERVWGMDATGEVATAGYTPSSLPLHSPPAAAAQLLPSHGAPSTQPVQTPTTARTAVRWAQRSHSSSSTSSSSSSSSEDGNTAAFARHRFAAPGTPATPLNAAAVSVALAPYHDALHSSMAHVDDFMHQMAAWRGSPATQSQLPVSQAPLPTQATHSTEPPVSQAPLPTQATHSTEPPVSQAPPLPQMTHTQHGSHELPTLKFASQHAADAYMRVAKAAGLPLAPYRLQAAGGSALGVPAVQESTLLKDNKAENTPEQDHASGSSHQDTSTFYRTVQAGHGEVRQRMQDAMRARGGTGLASIAYNFASSLHYDTCRGLAEPVATAPQIQVTGDSSSMQVARCIREKQAQWDQCMAAPLSSLYEGCSSCMILHSCTEPLAESAAGNGAGELQLVARMSRSQPLGPACSQQHVWLQVVPSTAAAPHCSLQWRWGSMASGEGVSQGAVPLATMRRCMLGLPAGTDLKTSLYTHAHTWHAEFRIPATQSAAGSCSLQIAFEAASAQHAINWVRGLQLLAAIAAS